VDSAATTSVDNKPMDSSINENNNENLALPQVPTTVITDENLEEDMDNENFEDSNNSEEILAESGSNDDEESLEESGSNEGEDSWEESSSNDNTESGSNEGEDSLEDSLEESWEGSLEDSWEESSSNDNMESGSNEGEDSLEESWEESWDESSSNEMDSNEDSWEESSSNEMDSNEDSWDESGSNEIENSNEDVSEDQSTETLFPSNPETTFASSSSTPDDFDENEGYFDNMDLTFEDVRIQDPVIKKVDLGGYSSSSGSGNHFGVSILPGIAVLLGAAQLV